MGDEKPRPARVREALERLQESGALDHLPPRLEVPEEEECRHRWHDQAGERAAACPSCGVEGAERFELVSPSLEQAEHLLQLWLDWCFDTGGSKARPDKWTKEFLAGLPMTGGLVPEEGRGRE